MSEEAPNTFTDSAPLFQINLLQQYINALIVNVKLEPLPREFNLIFDSGAVNGIMGIGAALYLRHLEKLKYIKINKVSGCSIGSLIAVWYLCGCPNTMYGYIETLFWHYKNNKNFFVFEQIVHDTISKLFPAEADVERLNGIFYINYYDTKDSKQCVVSQFENRAHLIACILRSSHIPFITNVNHKFEGRYVDGIAPYIFPEDMDTKKKDNKKDKKDNNCKNLFIQLIQFTAPFKSLDIKNEQNIYSRLIRGVVDTNEFFINDSDAICSHVNYKTKLHLYTRKKIVYLILFLIEYFILIREAIPDSLKKTELYHRLASLCRSLWLKTLNQVV